MTAKVCTHNTMAHFQSLLLLTDFKLFIIIIIIKLMQIVSQDLRQSFETV